MLFDFGQPTDGIFQSGFIVEDIDLSIEQFSARLNIGPWTTIRDVGPHGAVYRGEPATAIVHVAFGFSGHLVYELIQQVNDVPSPYRDVIDDRGYGFHHFGYATPSFDQAVAAMAAAGFENIGGVQMPDLRLAYIDTRDVLPGMVELIEANESVNASFTAMWKASIGERGEPAPPPTAPPSVPASS
jgi:hypothetical protein